MILAIILLSILVVILVIVDILNVLMTKSVMRYLKKIDRHPTDEELNACINETIKEIFFRK